MWPYQMVDCVLYHTNIYCFMCSTESIQHIQCIRFYKKHNFLFTPECFVHTGVLYFILLLHIQLSAGPSKNDQTTSSSSTSSWQSCVWLALILLTMKGNIGVTHRKTYTDTQKPANQTLEIRFFFLILAGRIMFCWFCTYRFFFVSFSGAIYMRER